MYTKTQEPTIRKITSIHKLVALKIYLRLRLSAHTIAAAAGIIINLMYGREAEKVAKDREAAKSDIDFIALKIKSLTVTSSLSFGKKANMGNDKTDTARDGPIKIFTAKLLRGEMTDT